MYFAPTLKYETECTFFLNLKLQLKTVDMYEVGSKNEIKSKVTDQSTPELNLDSLLASRPFLSLFGSQ